MGKKILVWIIVIAALVGIAALSIHIKSCISESDMPLWLKIELLK